MNPTEALELAKSENVRKRSTGKGANPLLAQYKDVIVVLKKEKKFSFEMITEWFKENVAEEGAPGPQSIRNYLVDIGEYEPVERAKPEEATQESDDSEGGDPTGNF